MKSALLITAAEYAGLPAGGPQYQLVEGDLLLNPAPIPLHQIISRNLEFLLFEYARRTGCGEIFYAPVDVFLSPHDVVQPDICLVLAANLRRISGRGIEGAPDLVVEVLSPGTESLDRGAKLKLYARAGVRELWLLDPRTRRTEIYDLERDPEKPCSVLGREENASSRLLPGFAADLKEVFPL